MALVYGDNYVHIIKKNNIEYKVRDAVAEAAINTIQGDAETEGSILKAKADAISTAAADATSKANAAQAAAESTAAADATSKANAAETAAKGYADGLASNYDAAGSAAAAQSAAENYAKGLVDKVLGDDSAAETLTTLKNVINELNDPDNAQGITGTFVDTVKAGLSGLGNTETVYYTQEEADAINAQHASDPDWAPVTTSTIKTAARPITVKEYVDDAVSGASSGAASAIAALDATVASTGGTNVAVQVVETDGVITGVTITSDNSINATDLSTRVGAIDVAESGTSGEAGYVAPRTRTVKEYVDESIAGQTPSSIENGVLTLGL